MDASSNPRPSRWSDAPPSQAASAGTQDGNITSSDKRPSSTAPEPPFKKTRVELGQTQGGDTASGYGGDLPSGYSGSSEPLAGLRSAPGSLGYGASSVDQSYGSGSSFGNSGFGSFAPGSAKGSGTGALFYKTKLCTKFKLGSCTFNERCHFAHGVEDLRNPPPGWEEAVKQGPGVTGRNPEPPRKSNKPCRYYVDGNCPYGDRCTFSHGNEDAQRGTAPAIEPLSGTGTGNASGRVNYKTRLCTRWEKGEPCVYGDKCHFAHGQAELQAYSGGSNYNTTAVTPPTMYSDPSMTNPPSMAAPYGAPLNYGSAGGPPPPTSTGLNQYPIAGMNLNSYGAQPDGTNGYSTNYSYWNPENKWDGANPAASALALAPAPAPPAPASTQGYGQANQIPTQGYGQVNQSAPWMVNYSVEGGYPKNETSTAPPYYAQEQSHQQPNVPYYGSAPNYQDPNQSVNTLYAQGGTQNGDGVAYYGASYPNQHTGYTSSFNTA